MEPDHIGRLSCLEGKAGSNFNTKYQAAEADRAGRCCRHRGTCRATEATHRRPERRQSPAACRYQMTGSRQRQGPVRHKRWGNVSRALPSLTVRPVQLLPATSDASVSPTGDRCDKTGLHVQAACTP